MNQVEKNTFIEAYNTHANAIFRYCYFRVYDKERARDLMQDTFTKTWEYLANGNTIDNVKAFLYRVAHNLCVNEQIRSKPVSLDMLQEENNFEVVDQSRRSPEEEADLKLVLNKLKSLRPPDRDLLLLRYVDDLTVSEIAALQNQLPNTITVRIKRALSELKNKINPQ